MDHMERTKYRLEIEKRLHEWRAHRPQGTPAEVEALVHDLEVHQIELEMQNEELRRAQAELEQSRHRYADLYDFAPVGYFSFDSDGHVREVNLTGADLLGIPRGRVLNKLFSSYLQREDIAPFVRHLRLAWASGRRESCSLRLKKGGRWIQLESLLTETAHGRQCRTSVIDIHIRREAEREARASQRQLQLFFESATDYAIFLMDADGDITDWNAGAERILGYREAEVLQRPGDIMYLPEDRAAGVPQRERASAERNGTALDERWHVRKDGSRFWASGVLTALREQGRLTGYAKVLRDLTDRKAAEEARNAEHARLKTVIDHIPAAVAIVDRGGNLLLHNARAAALGGDKLAGSDINTWAQTLRLLHADGRAYAPAEWPLARALRGETVHGEEIVYAPDDTQRRTWMVAAAPVRDSAGDVAAAVVTFYDITGRRLLELEAAKASKLETIGVLAGGIAHDFNNLLTAILGNIYMVKLDLPEGGELQLALEDAEQACIRAAALTQQLLTFARGGAPIKRAQCAATLLRETATAAASRAAVYCEIELASNLWHVEADAGQIAQVMNNLIVNAKQAMPQPGGRVWLRADNVMVTAADHLPLAPGPYVRVRIEDEGVGIPPGQQQKIFDPFFTTAPERSGLGLTAAHWIVQRHRGHIAASARRGGGACMTVYLPARAQAPVTATPAAEIPAAPASLRVLIMDDEAIIRDALVRLLQHFGHEAEATADGAAAIERYRAVLAEGRRFDVVILDLTVPMGMGGEAAVAELRRLDPTVCALVSSGYADDPAMADPARFGFSAAVVKPYRADDLRQALQALAIPQR